jgi:uncharacterized protein (TIGR02611 family)
VTPQGQADQDREAPVVRYARLAAIRARIRANAAMNVIYRGGVFVVGWSIVAVGVAMLVLPGPGWAAIFLGLAILATEFVWAHHLLGRVRAWARAAASYAMDPRWKRLRRVILVATPALLVGAVWWYVASFEWTLDGFRTVF